MYYLYTVNVDSTILKQIYSKEIDNLIIIVSGYAKQSFLKLNLITELVNFYKIIKQDKSFKLIIDITIKHIM